jgi:hypothetical protein
MEPADAFVLLLASEPRRGRSQICSVHADADVHGDPIRFKSIYITETSLFSVRLESGFRRDWLM